MKKGFHSRRLIAALMAALLSVNSLPITALAEETDLAIKYYEESLELCKQHGKASTDLMKLYNKKRQEAAEAKDDEKVKEYMDKVQNLMQMSKDMIRGNA